MEYLVQFQTNIFALLVLLILFLVIRLRLRVRTYGKTLLVQSMIFTGVALIIDPLTWIFDGMTFPGAYFLEYATNFLLFLLAPLIISIMLSYVRYKLLGEQPTSRKAMLQNIPLWFTLVMLIINFFEPVYFIVDRTTNVYSAGSLVWMHYGMIFAVYLYMTILSFVYRKRVKTYVSMSFALYFLVPLIGVLFQIVNIDVYYSWSFVVLSILIVYTVLESVDGQVDYLTDLFNRRSYEAHLSRLIKREEEFQLLYIDLDHFKSINDKHGHLVGDQVLIGFADVLLQVFPDDLIVRLGGDEFIVVVKHILDLDASINDIYNILNEQQEPIASVQFSFGCQPFDVGMTLDEIYKAADDKMYQHKQRSNKLKRRKSDQ